MPTIHLALQGGGSHGAYTWGVLDALLADGRLAPAALSGTSAGAVNAVALASGWATALAAGRDPRDGARQTLAQLWERIAAWDALAGWQRHWARLLWGGDWLAATPRPVSPYQSNPLGLNPLRDLLRELVDWEAVATGPLRVHACATHVATGQPVVFSGRQLTCEAVLASACLPLLFQAVEIDGQAYWDGGYSANPALQPLLDDPATRDILLVRINPVHAARLPRTTAEILDRVSELTFNASLLAQLGQLARQPGGVQVHQLAADAALADWPASTRASTDAAMLRQLRDRGREAATAWLAAHGDRIGRAAPRRLPPAPRWLGRLWRRP